MKLCRQRACSSSARARPSRAAAASQSLARLVPRSNSRSVRAAAVNKHEPFVSRANHNSHPLCVVGPPGEAIEEAIHLAGRKKSNHIHANSASMSSWAGRHSPRRPVRSHVQPNARPLAGRMRGRTGLTAGRSLAVCAVPVHGVAARSMGCDCSSQNARRFTIRRRPFGRSWGATAWVKMLAPKPRRRDSRSHATRQSTLHRSSHRCYGFDAAKA